MESAEYLRGLIKNFEGVKYANLTQLAQKAEVNQGNLSEFMRGKRKNLSFDTVWRIMKVLGVEMPSLSENKKITDSKELELEEMKRQLYIAEGRIAELRYILSQNEEEAQRKRSA